MSSINLVEKAKELKALFEDVIKDNQRLAQKPKEYMAETEAHLGTLIERLQYITENCVQLTNLESQQKAMLGNVQFWDSIPPGAVNGDALADLVKSHSKTLKVLHQRAINISKILKFSEKELQIASEIGDNFSLYQEGWSSFKRALAPNGNGRARAKTVSSIDNFLTFLKRNRVIANYRLFFLRYEKGGATTKWVETKIDFAERLHPSDEIMFEFNGFDQHLANFFTGNWFNAYAYTVFSDQLQRLESDHEIYSMVHFNQANAGRRTSGDFDLIVNIGERLLLVECKSGRIVKDSLRDDFQEIIEKTETLKEAFKSTRITGYDFLLLFNPELTDSSVVHKHFDPLGKAVTPGEIRGVVIDLITRPQ